MAAAYGVHIGASSACIAVFKDDKADVVANDSGDRVTPAVVAFTDHDQSVGLAAKQGLTRNAANTICNVKQIVGRKSHDPVVQEAMEKSVVKIIDKEGQPAYEVTYKEKVCKFTPEKITELIYNKMMETAESHGGTGTHDAVLTVPVSFSPEQRNAISTAAQKAGFNVLRVINEPTAAALAYDIGQSDIHAYSNVLIFRLGGTSLAVTVLNVNSGMYRILAHTESSDVGGDMFTDLLVEYFAGEFKRQWKMDPLENKRARAKLRSAAATCKHVLSTLKTGICSVDSLHEGVDFQGSVSRARFDSMCTTLIQKCLQYVDQTLSEAHFQKEDIQKVVICGGATKVPCLQNALTDYFPNIELLCNLNPDEVIAIGAAKEAAILCGNEEESKLNEVENEFECLPEKISVKVSPDTTKVTVFPVLTPIPVRKQHTFKLTDENTNFHMQVLEGEETVLANIIMNNLPSLAEVLCVFHVRREGSLHVTCTEKTSGTVEDILIDSAANVTVKET